MATPGDNEYGPRLSHLEGQVGGLSVQVQNLSGGMTELGHKIDRVVDRIGKSHEVNWGWIVAALLALGAVITLYTNPIKELAIANASAITSQEKVIQQIRDEQTKAHASFRADLDALTDRVDEIDQYGSRRWADPNGPRRK